MHDQMHDQTNTSKYSIARYVVWKINIFPFNISPIVRFENWTERVIFWKCAFDCVLGCAFDCVFGVCSIVCWDVRSIIPNVGWKSDQWWGLPWKINKKLIQVLKYIFINDFFLVFLSLSKKINEHLNNNSLNNDIWQILLKGCLFFVSKGKPHSFLSLITTYVLSRRSKYLLLSLSSHRQKHLLSHHSTSP